MIGHDIARVLPELRAQAESLMFDKCVARRITGETTDDDGRVTPTYDPTPVYSGACAITGDRPYEQARETGGATTTVQRYLLKVPATAGPFDEGVVVEITESRFQPHLVGNVYRIAGRDERTAQTSQRMYVEII